MIPDPERKHRDLVHHLSDTVNSESSNAEHSKAECGKIQVHLQQLDDSHPEFANPNRRTAISYKIYALFIVAAYILDVLLIGSFAEYRAQLLFANWPGLGTIARFLLPASLLTVELAIAVQRQHAKEEIVLDERTGAVKVWTVIGILWALIVPVIVASTPTRFPLMTVALTIIAFLLHVALLFCGQMAHDARGCFEFWRTRRRLKKQFARVFTAYRYSRDKAVKAFSLLMRMVHPTNSSNPAASIVPGPFNRAASELIHQEFSADILTLLNANWASGHPALARPPVNFRSAPQQHASKNILP